MASVIDCYKTGASDECVEQIGLSVSVNLRSL